LNENGIVEPTPIQEKTIPALLMGKDIIAQAQTGTGKTLAFILPILKKINIDRPHIQALVITPTRELAIQITAEAKKYAQVKSINILAAYGGQDVEQQIRKLKGDIHMVIGTPGRLLDHMRRGTISLSKLRILVLDEADQMLHMGFLKEVEAIIQQTPDNRHTMLFSATMPSEIRNMASRYLKEHTQIQVENKKVTLDEIRQIIIDTTDRGKANALFKTLDEYRPFMAIIFCRTKRRASTLNQALFQRGYNSDELHGDLTQAKREKVMKSFRNAEIQFLVATDVAARGLDIEGITHVFNYDIPQDVESYIHRIGRTGRAGQKGVAITFVTPKDYEALRNIEKGIKKTLEIRKILKEKDIDIDKFEKNLKKYKTGYKSGKKDNKKLNQNDNGRKNNTKKQHSKNEKESKEQPFSKQRHSANKTNFSSRGKQKKRESGSNR
ncbi:MAG: DEAD/DEAH box helicase, partial [Thermotaleaceae bacterium]